MKSLILTLCLAAAASVSAHDAYLGTCPDFRPMDNFNFDQVLQFRYSQKVTKLLTNNEHFAFSGSQVRVFYEETLEVFKSG